ncbi:hypothetical protein [Streptomyces sp. NPDC048650]|uniref:hypothetical protein n=1 Tax=unclassified Streptomyces TaxID=2593676 RepID=UPI00371B613D
MRMSRKAGLLVSAAVCGTLALGAAGTALASMNDAPARPAGSARQAPLPNTDALKTQARNLGDLAGVLRPVTDLIDDVLAAADSGRLTPTQVTAHTTAIRDALTAARQSGPEAPSAPSISQPDNGSRATTGKAAAELRTDALTGLQNRTDALLKALSSGDTAIVTSAVTSSVTALANVLVAITLGGLPAPDLPGLPSLPRLPGGIV